MAEASGDAQAEIEFEFFDGGQCSIPQSAVEKIPFLATLISTALPTSKSSSGHFVLPEQVKPGFIRPIVKYVETGRSDVLLKKLPRKENVIEFFEALNFLALDPPKNYQSLIEISKGLRSTCGAFDDRKDGHYSSEKPIGRSNCVAFIYGLANNAYPMSDAKSSAKIISNMEFVFSHPRAFGKRIRFHSRKLFESKVEHLCRGKQLPKITKWFSKFDGAFKFDDESGSDQSTDEEEKFYSYDSDDYDYD
jgi:hypothetical protein